MPLGHMRRTLPLGIDFGASRIRVALAERTEDGRIELIAVAVREHANDPVAALSSAVAELHTRERRCVFGLTEPLAVMRSVHFPPMRRGEQERAARFEATKFVDYPIDEATVRVIPLPDGDSLIGIVRKNAIATCVRAAHAAKLRIIAVDNASFAFARALPEVDAVLDVGLTDSRLHVFTAKVPVERHFRSGGAAFDAAIVRALGCDEPTAQRRKHSIGIAGCAEGETALLVADIANALADCRAAGIGDVRSLALAGNGSRLPELPLLLERATAVRVRLAAFAPTISRTLPPDVLRAAAPDWCLAYGLALWGAP